MANTLRSLTSENSSPGATSARQSAPIPETGQRDSGEARRHDEPSRVRYAFLDGLRALAACYVVLHHARNDVRSLHPALAGSGSGLTGSPEATWFFLTSNWMRFGHHAVSVFIVISGYCLMLPVIRAGTTGFPGGVRGYFTRRARRILPPYYAALALSLAGFLALNVANYYLGAKHRIAVPTLSIGDLLSHLGLVHNLSPVWAKSINPPMWSIATEWQIYFLFPALLIPVWRRYGNLAAVAFAFALGGVPYLLISGFYCEYPWYVGLFAMGMVGAAVSSSSTWRTPTEHRLRFLLLSATALFLAFVACQAFITAHPPRWAMDVLLGAAAVCIIVYCAGSGRTQTSGRGPLLLRVLASRRATSVGAFSYSVYLLHHPILMVLTILILRLSLSPVSTLACLLVIGFPLVIWISHLFHRVFERPFMSSARGTV